MASIFNTTLIILALTSVSHAAIVMTEGMSNEAFLKVVNQGPNSVYNTYSGKYTPKKAVKEDRVTSLKSNRFDAARATASHASQHYTSKAVTTEFGMSFADRVQSHSR